MRDVAQRQTYTVEEAGRLLGIGRNQAYDAAKRGEIPTITIGKRKLVPKATFDRLLGVVEPPGPLPERSIESAGPAPRTSGTSARAENRGTPAAVTKAPAVVENHPDAADAAPKSPADLTVDDAPRGPPRDELCQPFGRPRVRKGGSARSSPSPNAPSQTTLKTSPRHYQILNRR
jgi:excisionase family DNA binding protein